MRIHVIGYEPLVLFLRPYKFFFQQLHCIDFYSCEIVSSSDMRRKRRIELRPLRMHNGGCFETLYLLHVSSCEMFTLCDVLYEAKRNTQTNSRECAVRTENHL